MNVKPLRSDLQKILNKHQLKNKYTKATRFLTQNPKHPSLHTEKLHPKHKGLYSFRLDKKWRAIFIVISPNTIEIIDINPHYND